MSKQVKLIVGTIFLFLFAVLNVWVIFGLIQPGELTVSLAPRSGQPIKQPVERPFITFDARVDEHVIILRKETHEESIALLVSLDMYHYPLGVSSETISLGKFTSFDPKHDMWTIDRIFGNRRFLKVLAESQDQTGSSGAVLRDGLKTDIAGYLAKYEIMFESLKSILEQDSTAARSVAFSTADRMDPLETPTINGMRLKMLSSILVLSHLRDRQAFETVLKISNLAIKQRDQLFADQDIPPGAKYSIISRVSLYHKRILATALLNMSGENEIAEKYEWEEFKMVNFDAKATPYDRHVVRGVEKIDYPPKDRIVRLIVPLSDNEFSALMKKFN